MNKLMIVVAALPLITLADPVNRYVSKNLDYGSGPNGEVVEGDAVYSDLQEAINAAQVDSKTKVGDTVWVKDGFVCDSGFGGRDGTTATTNRIYINKAIIVRSQSGDVDEAAGKGVTVRGAFAEGDPTSSTYMHCSTSSVRCVYIGKAATLQGFILEGGSCRGAMLRGGGGLFVEASNAIVTNCLVRNNYGYNGGGICMYSAGTIVDCVITNNIAKAKWNDLVKNQFEGGAGGVQGLGVLRNCHIENNLAWQTGGGVAWGGGSGDVITNCVVINNTARGKAGGIQFSGGTTYVTDCLIATNTVTGGPAGGICVGYMCNSVAHLRQCKIEKNSCTQNGGGVWSQEDPINKTGYANLVDCEILDNTAGSGGGLYGSFLCATNCIVRGNAVTSTGGGCDFCKNGRRIRVCNTLIADNTANQWGGGVTATSPATGFTEFVNCTIVNNALTPGHPSGSGGIDGKGATLINTICWNNSAPSGVDYEQIRAATNSCIHLNSGVEQGPGCIDEDPQFVGSGAYPYLVNPFSPCRGAGYYDAADPEWAWATDKDCAASTALNEVPRVQGGKIDMGCYERAVKGLLILVN